MRLAFTGTQAGLTDAQRFALETELLVLPKGELHHGDCIGADAECHDLAAPYGWEIHVHPCTIAAKRAFRNGAVVYAPMPPLERNRIIVRRSERLIACPKGFHEELRSGTWATIRFARKLGMTTQIIWPDGSSATKPGSFLGYTRAENRPLSSTSESDSRPTAVNRAFRQPDREDAHRLAPARTDDPETGT